MNLISILHARRRTTWKGMSIHQQMRKMLKIVKTLRDVILFLSVLIFNPMVYSNNGRDTERKSSYCHGFPSWLSLLNRGKKRKGKIKEGRGGKGKGKYRKITKK